MNLTSDAARDCHASKGIRKPWLPQDSQDGALAPAALLAPVFLVILSPFSTHRSQALSAIFGLAGCRVMEMGMDFLAYYQSSGFGEYLADMVGRAVIYGAVSHFMRRMSGGEVALLAVAAVGVMWMMSRRRRW